MDDLHQLEIFDREWYVHSFLTGETANSQSVIEAFQKIADYCIEHKQTKLLYESKFSSEMSFHDLEQIANKVTTFGFDSIICAVLISFPNRQFDMDMAINIANARGSHFRVFLNKDTAIQWLLDSELSENSN